jgi:protein phosphatase
MQTCPRCATTVIDSNKECNNCGMSMEQVICANCANILDKEADFCDSCGFYMNREFQVVTNAKLNNEQLINKRYIVLDSDENVLKDTLPNLHTFYSTPVSDTGLLELYKRLAKHVSIPRLYDAFSFENNDFLVLRLNKDNYGQSLRNIKEAWVELTDREKLQLLRDWAGLYQILEKEKALSTVLDPYNLFVDDDITIKVKHIKTDSADDTSLSRLGALWSSLIFVSGTPSIDLSHYKVGEVVRYLNEGKLNSLEDLIKRLDELLEEPVADIVHFSATNVGRRRMNNEDNLYAATLDLKEHGINRIYNGKRGLYIVCDGMGGHESGEVASATAISSIRATILPSMSFSLGFEDIKKLLEKSITTQANDAIFQINEEQKRTQEKRMGTTVVLAMVIDSKVYTAHVGDSRMYLITGDAIEQVTEDHNVAMKNYRDGMGTFEDAINNTKTSWGKVLTQALGPKSSETIYPEINTFNLKEDSYLILCSDGLTDMVTSENIEKIVRDKWDDPKQVVNTLIETANNNGGRDNISVVGAKISLMPPLFPPVDYSEVFYNNEIDMNNEIIEMVETQEKALEGINMEP